MRDFMQRLFTGIIFTLALWGFFLLLTPRLFSLALAAVAMYIIVCEWPRFFSPDSWKFWLIMPLYPLLPFALLLYLNETPEYHRLVFYIFVLTFSFDTGSYIVGRLWGRRKILPCVSPGKTWEGFVGGCVAIVIACAITMAEFGILGKFSITHVMFVLAIGAVSLAGDLFESWLKRRVNLKDSGTLLPGHGGFLDRFDGILAASVLWYLFKDVMAPLL